MTASTNVPPCDLRPGDWITGITFAGEKIAGRFERYGEYTSREYREIVVDGLTYKVWDGDGFTVLPSRPQPGPRHTPKVIYDITDGIWRLRATTTEPGKALVEVFQGDKLRRDVHTWAYRVWNYAAHRDDIVAEIEALDDRRRRALAMPMPAGAIRRWPS